MAEPPSKLTEQAMDQMTTVSLAAHAPQGIIIFGKYLVIFMMKFAVKGN